MIATFHNHTTFCDGKNTPREMVEYAYENGIRAIGLSGHGYAPYDLGGCMKDAEGYVSEVNVGAILRNYRTTPYPYENLLYKINEADDKIILSLDVHDNKFLTYNFS